MELVKDRTGEDERVYGWNQIALAMSAKVWTSSGSTYTLEFNEVVCQNRYHNHKGAFIAPDNVTWTEERHLHLMGLVKDRKGVNKRVSGWNQIALAMSAKVWTSSEGETYTMKFNEVVNQNRYHNHNHNNKRALIAQKKGHRDDNLFPTQM